MFVLDERGESDTSNFFNRLLGLKKTDNGYHTTSRKDVSFSLGGIRVISYIHKPVNPDHRADFAHLEQKIEAASPVDLVVVVLDPNS